MKSYKLSLSTRITLLVALVFLISLALLSYVHYRSMKEFSHESEVQKSRLLTESIAPVAAVDLYLDMQAPLQEYLMKIIQQNPMVLKLTVTDNGGTRYFYYESPALKTQEHPPIVLAKTLHNQVDDRPIGTLTLAYSNARYETLLGEYRRFTWITMIATTFLLLLLLGKLRADLAPLKKLANDLRRYDPGRHNFTTERIPETNEIGIIHNAMVEMFEKIEEFTTRLFQLNLQLETKVRERTQILEETNTRLQREIEERTRTEEALKHANELLEQLSVKDALTGLYNRRMFDQTFQNHWKTARRESMPISLVLCDIDFFKRINDRFGHLAGDRCLQELAQILRRCIKRPMDSVARYGGEEFVFVLPDTPTEGAVALAREIQHRLKERNRRETGGIPFTLSMGIATLIPQLGTEKEELIRQADAALYEAKRRGRDRIVTYPFQPDETAQARDA